MSGEHHEALLIRAPSSPSFGHANGDLREEQQVYYLTRPRIDVSHPLDIRVETVQVTKQAGMEIWVMKAIGEDAKRARVCLMAMRPLSETKQVSRGQEPGLAASLGERDRTDVTREIIDKIEPSNRGLYVARELLPRDEELVKAMS